MKEPIKEAPEVTYIFADNLEYAARLAARALCVEEYYELCMAEMTDDVQCDPSTILTRGKRMEQLQELLGEETAEEIWAEADEAALKNGYYASGAPYPF